MRKYLQPVIAFLPLVLFLLPIDCIASDGDPKATELLKICSVSCSRRGGVYTFQVFGDKFNPDGDLYKCACSDEVTHKLKVIPRQETASK